MAYSGQERIAFQTGYNDGVFGRPRENPYNIDTVPRSWRAYEEGYDEGEGSTVPPRGPAGPQGEPGEQGSQGIPGIPGVNGSDGLSFLQGAGPPGAGTGNPGDTYWDNTTAGDIYEKTGPTTWTFVSRIGEVTLATQIDDEGGSPQIIYKGEAAAGSVTSVAVWRMSRITVTTDVGGNDDLATEWADGNTNFDNIWDNRASLSYS